jgi:hypothetical protein
MLKYHSGGATSKMRRSQLILSLLSERGSLISLAGRHVMAKYGIGRNEKEKKNPKTGCAKAYSEMNARPPL